MHLHGAFIRWPADRPLPVVGGTGDGESGLGPGCRMQLDCGLAANDVACRWFSRLLTATASRRRGGHVRYRGGVIVVQLRAPPGFERPS